MPLPLLPTSLVGSYAQPEWLIDRNKLAGRFPPRVRALELWRVAPEYLDQAQDDATLLAIRDQERAGLDIITDGEQRRESYSNRFATALEGVDIDNPGSALDRSGNSWRRAFKRSMSMIPLLTTMPPSIRSPTETPSVTVILNKLRAATAPMADKRTVPMMTSGWL